MNKKDWKDRLVSVEKLLESAKFNEKKAKEDQEDLILVMDAYRAKIKTFK